MSEMSRRFVGRMAAGLPLTIPYGSVVRVVAFFPRRRVLVEHDGRLVLTMGYHLRKEEPCHPLVAAIQQVLAEEKEGS